MVSRRADSTAAETHRSLEQALTRFPAATVRTNAEYRDHIEGQLGQMTNLLYALLAMSLVISLFGSPTTCSCRSTSGRASSACCARSARRGAQIRRVVRYESVITSVIGGVLGVVVGVFFAWLIDLGARGPRARLRRAGGAARRVPGARGRSSASIGAVVPARRGARIDVLKALHHE